MSSQNIYDEAHHYNSEATLGDGMFGSSRHAAEAGMTQPATASSSGTMTPSSGGGDGVRQGFNTAGSTIADYSNSSTESVSPVLGKSIENYNGRPDKNGILGQSEGYTAQKQAQSEQIADAAHEKEDMEQNKMFRKQQMDNLAPRVKGVR